MSVKLLLIEDDEDIRCMIKEYICQSSSNEIEILEANNGLAGFNLLNKTCPDIIVTDLAMPEMDGVQLMELLEIKNNQAPVLVYSGRSDLKDFSRRFKTVKLFSKPQGLNSLISEIQRISS